MVKLVRQHPKESILVIVFIVLFVFMAILSPGGFLTSGNMSSMASQIPEFGILALAMMIVILKGGINLSITYVASLSGIVMALIMNSMNKNGADPGTTIAISLVAGLATAIVCGILNGWLVAYMRVSPILATLGTSMLFEGIGMNVTEGRAISGLPEAFNNFGSANLFGIPVSLFIFLIIAVLAWFLFERTPWGVRVHMIGNNPVAMEYSGVNVQKQLLQVYIISALFGFFSAVVMTARYNSMKVDYGSSYMLQSVLAVVLGGGSMAGGYGTVFGTALAVFTLQVVSSGLNIFGLNRFFTDIIMGALLILVLAFNFIFSEAQAKRRSKNTAKA